MDEKVIYGLIISLLLFISASFLIYKRNQVPQNDINNVIEETKEIITPSEEIKKKNAAIEKFCDECLENISSLFKVLIAEILLVIVLLVISYFNIIKKTFDRSLLQLAIIFIKNVFGILVCLIIIISTLFSYNMSASFKESLKSEFVDIEETDLEKFANKIKDNISTLKKTVFYISPVFGVAGIVCFLYSLFVNTVITGDKKSKVTESNNKDNKDDEDNGDNNT